jgi:SAM-dependent methyltransferase
MLRVPDGCFEVVAAPGLARVDVGLEDVERAVKEIARVLRPGGLAVLSLFLRLSESGDRIVADLPQQVLSASEIRRHVIDAAGLVPIDPLDWSVSPVTNATRRPWRDVLSAEQRLAVDTPIAPGAPPLRDLFPQIVLEHHGVTFTTVHLALERPM